MEQNIEIRKALLQEEIKITRKLLEIGYHPYKIKFAASGSFEIEGREACGDDQKLIEDRVKEFMELCQVSVKTDAHEIALNLKKEIEETFPGKGLP